MSEQTAASRIYLTYKTRMTTEARLRSSARLWQILLTYYSFFMIVFALLELSGNYKIYQSQVLMAILSTATFGISLYISGERYTERADQFKSCYLKLQAIFNSDVDLPEKMKRYSEVLDVYENQSDDDYDEMRYDAYWRGQELRNSSGIINPERSMLIRIFMKRMARFIYRVFLFAVPLIFAVCFIRLKNGG